jgi:hypothetical protein
LTRDSTTSRCVTSSYGFRRADGWQLKVGADPADDLRRGQLIRSIIDNPANMPKDRKPIDPESIKGKNAGPTGCVLMIDANRALIRQATLTKQRFGTSKRQLIMSSSLSLSSLGSLRNQRHRMMLLDTLLSARASSLTESVSRLVNTRTTE